MKIPIVVEDESFVKDPQTETLSFLVVEGDVTMRPLFDFILRQIHRLSHLDWAKNAEEAEILIKASRYDIIISEIHLPGRLTGVDLWRQCEMAPSRFVLMGSLSQGKMTKLFKKNEVFPIYMQKPLDPSEMTEVLKVMLTCRL